MDKELLPVWGMYILSIMIAAPIIAGAICSLFVRMKEKKAKGEDKHKEK